MELLNKIRKRDKTETKKDPWLAALLNFIFTGLGYLYVGKRKTFGALLLTSEFLVFAWILIDATAREMLTALTSSPLKVLATLLLAVAFALDAYNDAKTVK